MQKTSKTPKQIQNMLESFAKRHGIAAQMTAHDVMERAQEELYALVKETPLVHEMLILHLQKDVLTFACKNAAARYDAQGVADEVCRRLARHFPSMTIRASCVLRPEAWSRY